MIHFHTEEIKFTLKNKTLLKQWVKSVIEKKKGCLGELNFIFCSDEYLLAINQQYLNHATYTDIITFDYSKEKIKKSVAEKRVREISGDIYISIERVNENAKKFSKTFIEELHRVMIHGVLHLLGYKDKTKYAKALMTMQEDACVKLLEQERD